MISFCVNVLDKPRGGFMLLLHILIFMHQFALIITIKFSYSDTFNFHF